jgi:hypothetical protein
MKKLILPLVCLFLFSFTADALKLSEEEKAFAIKELTASKDQMMRTVDGLSEEQLNFKSSADSWSVAECVEHLAISEVAFHEMLQGALKLPADASKRAEVQMKDEQLLGIIRDRSNKVKTSEAFEPSGKFGSYEETMESLLAKRAEHIDYIGKTEDDLRNHYGKLPFGTIDGYQIILFMSGHMDRHVAQMDEIINHEDFPE